MVLLTYMADFTRAGARRHGIIAVLLHILIVMSALASSLAFASRVAGQLSDGINLAQVSSGKPVTGDILYWPDISQDGIKGLEERAKFRPLTNQKIVLGAQKHWYLMRLNNDSDNVRHFLATGMPSTPRLKLYRLELDGSWELLAEHSDDQAYNQRVLRYPLLFLPIDLPPSDSGIYLIEHESLANYPIAIRFFDEQKLQQKMAIFTLIRGIVFGALLVFLLFFIVQCVSEPSAPQIAYCFYIAALILLVGQIFGYNFAYLWPNSGSFNGMFTAVISGFTYCFYLLFSATLFDLKSQNSRLYRVAMGLASIVAVVALLNIFFDIFWLLAALAVIGLPVPIMIGVWAKRKKLTSSTLFLAGSILHCTFSYLLALECLGFHLGYSHYLFSFLSVGQVVDLGLFSMAILRQSSQVKLDLHEQMAQRLKDSEALAEAERQRAEMLADQKTNALNLATTSHVLTQPLAAIRFAIELIDDESASKAKSRIVETLNYSQELLKDMTAKGQDRYHSADAIQRLSSASLCARFQHDHTNRMHNQGLEFRCKYVVEEVIAMPVVLQRIIDNLLVNSARYTDKGGILLSFRRFRERVLIQVWDTGVGMNPEQVERLQQPFSQGGKASQEGYGLGLFIVKSLVASAGYQLHIRSELGRGTCVSLIV